MLKQMILGTVLLVSLVACPKRVVVDGDPSQKVSFQVGAKSGVELYKIGQRVITTDDIRYEYDALSMALKGKYSRALSKERFLANFMEEQILFQEALKRGYLERPQVQKSLRHMIVTSFRNDIRGTGQSKEKVSDEALQDYYRANKLKYVTPEKRNFYFVKADLTKGGVEQGVKDLRVAQKRASSKKTIGAVRIVYKQSTRIANGIRLLDHSISVDPETGFRSKLEITSLFGEHAAKKIWKLGKINRFSKVIDGGEYVGVFYYVSKKKPRNRTLANSRPTIARDYVRQKKNQKVTDLIDSLKNKFKVSVNEEAMAQIKPYLEFGST